MGRDDFARHIHGYINDFIKLADAKAGALLAVAGALIGLMANRIGSASAQKHADTLFFIALSFDVFLLVLSLLVVWPRRSVPTSRIPVWGEILSLLPPVGRSSGSARSLVFWEDVKTFTKESYKERIGSTPPDDLWSELIAHCHDLSFIASRKYTILRLAFLLVVPSLSFSFWWLAE